MIDIALLQKVRIFSGLYPQQMQLLQSILKEARFPKGDYILKEDSLGDTIYLLTEGKVKVTKELVKGIDENKSGDKVLASLEASLLPTFGENGILGHAPRTANVIAATDCLLYYITKQDFDLLATKDVNAAYQITLNIAQVLSDRLHSTDENLVKLATALYIAVQQ